MKTQGLCVITAMAILLGACQKEIGFDSPIVPDEDSTTNPVSNGDIKGNWKFLFADVSLRSVTESNESGATIKGVAFYDAISEKNGGTLKIDASQCVGTDFTYTVNTDVTLDFYLNGLKVDSQKMPMNYTVPNYGFTSDYTLIGSDSIYISSGFSVPVQDASMGSLQIPESGAKYQISSDTLMLVSKSNIEQAVNESGVNVKLQQAVSGIFYFKRQ